VLTLTASGSVGDYSDTSSLKQSVAAAAVVDVWFVTITVAAASVLITATITVPESTTASAVQSSLLFTLGGSTESVLAALNVTVESSPTVVIVLPPSAPPSMPPPSSPWEDTSIDGADGDDVTCNVFCVANLGFEIYILLGGIGLTMAVLCFAAYSKVRVKLSCADILSTLLAAGDALTDIAFTMQRLGIMHTTADQVVAALLLLFVMLPTAASASQVFVVLRSPHLDTERLKELSAFYALVLVVALTNMELLRLLPWREGPTMFDGLPDKRLMLRIWLLVMCLEDVPQLAIQVTVLRMVDTGGGVLAPLSIAFSVSAIVWRGMRKVIYLVPSNARISEVTVSGGAGTAQQPANPPAPPAIATATAASIESDTPPPEYDQDGLVIEQVDVVEKA
jgi:hypothetical protein